MMLGLGLSICAGGCNCQPAFNPATLSLTGWFRTNYIGAPWVGDVSASTSGSRQLIESTNPPTVGGTSLNSYAVADFDGVNDRLNDQVPIFLDNYLTASAWWIGTLVHIDAAAAPGANFFDDAALVGEQNGGWGIAVNSSGVRACNYDGAFQTTANVTIGGSWAWAEAWLSGGTLSCSVNGGTAATISAGNLTSVSARQLRIGANYNSSVFLDGQIAEIMIMASVPTAQQRASLRTNYLLNRYGLRLGS